MVGTVALALILGLIVFGPVTYLGSDDFRHREFVARAVYVLVLAAVLSLYRILVGPTASDRIVATDILGILIVGFCAVVAIATGRSWYIDIGIAWALQSFIGALALSKYLERRSFGE
jgi:multicomponent Na+:H+ antiporter subunit F